MQNKNAVTGPEAIGGAFIALAAWVGGIIFDGYVVATLWGWFMATTFGLPRLTLAPAIGVSLLVGRLTFQHPLDVTEKDRSYWGRLGRTITLIYAPPAVTLLLGWAVHAFMP